MAESEDAENMNPTLKLSLTKEVKPQLPRQAAGRVGLQNT